MLKASNYKDKMFVKNVKIILKQTKENFLLREHFNKIFFSLFGIIPLKTRKLLLSLQDNVIDRLFQYEAVKGRRLKQRHLIIKLRKVPSYMYYLTFLERIKKLPLVMPKEKFCYKKSVTTNFVFRLSYRHKVSLVKKKLSVLNIRKKINKKVLTKNIVRNNKKLLSIGFFQCKNINLVSLKLNSGTKFFLKYFFYSALKKNSNRININIKKVVSDGFFNNIRFKKFIRNIRKKKKILRRSGRYSSAAYRVKKFERRRDRRMLRLKRGAQKKVRILWSDLGLRFWKPKAVVMYKRPLFKMFQWTSNKKFVNVIKALLVIICLVVTTKHVSKLSIGTSYTPSLRDLYYKKYYTWLLLLEKQIRVGWRTFSSSVFDRKKIFKFFNTGSKKLDEIGMRGQSKNFFIVTFKWNARNFHINICSSKTGGGLFKTSSGLLGAKKKNKKRFRYVRKALHYFLRFILFYRGFQFRQQRKEFADHYYKFLDLWNSEANENRFSNRRAILIDTRRWIRASSQQLFLHLIMEWFGREEHYNVYAKLIKRLRKIQFRRFRSKVGRLKKALNLKKVNYLMRVKKSTF